MTDLDVIGEKLERIESYVAELRQLSEPQKIAYDVREERFVEYTLAIAIQAMLQVASLIVAEDRREEPQTLDELFEILARDGWVREDLVARLRSLVGLYESLAQDYENVDLNVVRDVAENRLDGLLEFVAQIQSRLAN